jgi:hypothetical protein
MSASDTVMPHVISAAVARRRDQPDGEPPLGSILRSPRPNGDPRLLRELSARFGIAHEPRARLYEAVGVALDEHGERIAHSGLRERHQLVVAAIGQAATRERDKAWRGHPNAKNTARAALLTQKTFGSPASRQRPIFRQRGLS